MPRILRGFGIDTASLWRGVGDLAPGSEWRWRAPGGSEVLCLFQPGGYGNAHRLGARTDELLRDLDALLAQSRAGVALWMNGNDHQPAEPDVPSVLKKLARPDVSFEHASLERAAELVRERIDVAALPAVEGELRRAAPRVPVLSGTWSSRSWQKARHDHAQALLTRLAEPFVALAGLERRQPLAHAWRLLLQCQPHDSICGCSIDDAHRDVDTRLRGVAQLARTLLEEAVFSLLGARTADFALHRAIAIVNPHPFVVTGSAEVAIQHPGDQPFRLMSRGGEVAYEILGRHPTDGPGGVPAGWLRLRVDACDILPHGLRVVTIEPGVPSARLPPSPLSVRAIPGGLEIDGITHTFEEEGDRGDLYDFCPVDERPATRTSRGIRMDARAVGRRVEIEVEVDQQTPDRRVRARFDLSRPPPSIWTETPFGWLERTTPGTHPVATTTACEGFAVGGPGLHEVERGSDGAVRLTLFRAVGWMSRGDLSTRPGHAGYNVPTPDAQGLGMLRFRYAIAPTVRDLEPGLIPLAAVALESGHAEERAFLSIEPAEARLSILKRANEGDGLILRICGSPTQTIDARVQLFRPIRRAWWSDLDERIGDEIPCQGDSLSIPIPPHEVVTLRLDL
jgi:hypothetical protein